MAVSPEKFFKIVRSVQMHFTQPSFDIRKYGTNSATIQSQCKGKFGQGRAGPVVAACQYLSKFSIVENEQDCVYLGIACALGEINPFYDDRTDVLDVYYAFKRRRESLAYVLKGEIESLQGTNFTTEELLFQCFTKKLSPEYILLTNEASLGILLIDPSKTYLRPGVQKLIKYSAFFRPEIYTYLLHGNKETSHSV